ncbi:MAG: hypothetical protein ACI85I_000299 [Arenicella sp.]
MELNFKFIVLAMITETTLLTGVAALLSTFTAIFGILLKIKNDNLKDMKAKLSEKKHLMYNEILSILFDLINGTKNLNTITEDDILLRFMNIKRDLILYGNDRIIRKFFE